MQYTRPDDSTINPPSERAGHACLTKPADWQDGPVTVHLGDCLDVMRGMPEASVDALRRAKAAPVAEGQLPLIEEVIAMPDPAQQLGLEGL